MIEPYAITLLRQLQEEAAAAGVSWAEDVEEGLIYFDVEDIVEVQVSNYGSIEIMIDCSRKPGSQIDLCRVSEHGKS